MTVEFKVGYSEGKEILVSREEQLRHLFVYGGSAQGLFNVFLLDIIKSKVKAGEGVLLIQGKQTQLKESLLNCLHELKEANNFFEINASDQYQTKERVCDVLFDKISKGYVVYVNFDGENKPIYTRVFMNALNMVFDKLRTAELNPSRRQHFNIISTNLEQIASPHWNKIINFARSLNITVVNSVGSYYDQLRLQEESELMHQVIDDLFEASGMKILYKQSSYDEDLELSRHIGIQSLTLHKKEIIQTDRKNTKIILNQLSNRQFVMFDASGVSVVNN